MKFSESDFFRYITLNICGSLQLETALQRSFDALKEVMPLDLMALHFYEPSLGALHTIHLVSNNENKSLDLITPLEGRAKAMLTDPEVPNVRIVNNIETDPVIKRMAYVLKVSPETSTVVIRLVLENQRVASIGFTANGLGRYTEEHARLLSLLNEPFAIAVAN
ncbi:MAG TPA: GAF domain-containing protein, partial [Desulfomonilaceae bacterium]|nr:GAF domain-containing protein [Desulfomonilaceae bacterium]